jgi:hypothetical protein
LTTALLALSIALPLAFGQTLTNETVLGVYERKAVRCSRARKIGMGR